MKCESCGAAMRPNLEQGIYVCEYCGLEVVPPPEADGVLILSETTAPCATCSAPLSDGALETRPLKYCSACHGMLISMDHLADLIEALRAHGGRVSTRVEPRNPADADRHLRCPTCGGQMEGHPYGGAGNVNVDSCERCAMVWLDRGELRRMAAAPDHRAPYGY